MEIQCQLTPPGYLWAAASQGTVTADGACSPFTSHTWGKMGTSLKALEKKTCPCHKWDSLTLRTANHSLYELKWYTCIHALTSPRGTLSSLQHESCHSDLQKPRKGWPEKPCSSKARAINNQGYFAKCHQSQWVQKKSKLPCYRRGWQNLCHHGDPTLPALLRDSLEYMLWCWFYIIYCQNWDNLLQVFKQFEHTKLKLEWKQLIWTIIY